MWRSKAPPGLTRSSLARSDGVGPQAVSGPREPRISSRHRERFQDAFNDIFGQLSRPRGNPMREGDYSDRPHVFRNDELACLENGVCLRRPLQTESRTWAG